MSVPCRKKVFQEREGIIKDCIAKKKYSVVELNIRLYEAGYQILGNKGAN